MYKLYNVEDTDLNEFLWVWYYVTNLYKAVRRTYSFLRKAFKVSEAPYKAVEQY